MSNYVYGEEVKNQHNREYIGGERRISILYFKFKKSPENGTELTFRCELPSFLGSAAVLEFVSQLFKIYS